MDVFNLSARIGLDTSDYEQGLRSVQQANSASRSDIMTLAHTYRQQGMDMSSAMKKAYEEIGNSQHSLSSSARTESNSFFDSWQGAFSKLSTVATTAVAALGALKIVDTFKNMVSSSLQSYAEYEQLIGGVETLFKDSADEMVQHAQEAYKTAGMSANEYMNTVTSFSASLISSLSGDTEKAVDYADKAITDMSDKMLVRLKRIEPCQGCGAKKLQEMAA